MEAGREVKSPFPVLLLSISLQILITFHLSIAPSLSLAQLVYSVVAFPFKPE
jgi:hypothetical protein